MYEKWFDRSVGVWSSQIKYMYTEKNEKKTMDILSIVEKRRKCNYTITWNTLESGLIVNEGYMNITLDGAYIYRSRGFFSTFPSMSKLSLSKDERTLKFVTFYDDMYFVEESTYLSDNKKSRHMHGSTKHNIFIVGCSIETRIKN